MSQSEAGLTDVRPRVPVLVLGQGLTALAAVRALGRRGTPLYVAGDPGDLVKGSRWYRSLPGNGVDQPSEKLLAERLQSLDLERLVLLPCSDAWVTAVSRLADELRCRFPASVAPEEILTRLTDKGRFAETLAELGIPHPRTDLLRTPDALAEIPDAAFARGFLKPVASGLFSRQYGVKGVRPRDRAHAAELLAAARAHGLELMLQEFLPGPPTLHVFLDGFIDRRGRVCGMLARRRLRMFPPDFGNSTSTVSIPVEEIRSAEASLRALLSGIRYRGVFSAEFKLDEREGVYKILEVNARPWWFVGFAADCGVDVCEMARRDALGEDVEPVTRYRIGMRCIHLRRDLESRRTSGFPGPGGLLRLAGSWIGARQLTFAWDDPRPGVRDMLAWGRPKLRRKLKR